MITTSKNNLLAAKQQNKNSMLPNLNENNICKADEQKIEKNVLDSYWKSNLQLLVILLVIWFIVSFVFGIFLVESLNEIRFFGFKLGFWFAQQGSIYVFVILIFVYAVCMKKLERHHKLFRNSDSS